MQGDCYGIRLWPQAGLPARLLELARLLHRSHQHHRLAAVLRRGSTQSTAHIPYFATTEVDQLFARDAKSDLDATGVDPGLDQCALLPHVYFRHLCNLRGELI